MLLFFIVALHPPRWKVEGRLLNIILASFLGSVRELDGGVGSVLLERVIDSSKRV